MPLPVSFCDCIEKATWISRDQPEKLFQFQSETFNFLLSKTFAESHQVFFSSPNCFCDVQTIHKCVLNDIVRCAVLLLCLCCLWMYTIERAACMRLPWEDFLICGFWPACHSLEAIHELSVLAISAKTLDAKISLDAVVQKEGNLGGLECQTRQGKSGLCKHIFTEQYLFPWKIGVFLFPAVILKIFDVLKSGKGILAWLLQEQKCSNNRQNMKH